MVSAVQEQLRRHFPADLRHQRNPGQPPGEAGAAGVLLRLFVHGSHGGHVSSGLCREGYHYLLRRFAVPGLLHDALASVPAGKQRPVDHCGPCHDRPGAVAADGRVFLPLADRSGFCPLWLCLLGLFPPVSKPGLFSAGCGAGQGALCRKEKPAAQRESAGKGLAVDGQKKPAYLSAPPAHSGRACRRNCDDKVSLPCKGRWPVRAGGVRR